MQGKHGTTSGAGRALGRGVRSLLAAAGGRTRTAVIIVDMLRRRWPVRRSNRESMDTAVGMTAQERELAELIVVALNLETPADEIDPAAPLYREGLGLDSIDVLEIALTVSKHYGLQLRSDDSDNARIFRSLRSLNQYVQQHRTR
jgi:acyl carrier protein